MASPPPAIDRFSPRAASSSGRRLVVGLVVLGVVAGSVAIAWQRGQTRRCLTFYGADVARAITSAPHVELWSDIRPGARPGSWFAGTRRDVSAAKGLVHLRRGLVEDANFILDPAPAPAGGAEGAGGAAPAGGVAWQHVLVFSDSPVTLVDAGAGGGVAICLDGPDGAGTLPRRLAVVGRPGVLEIGRIGRGLRAWIDATGSAESP